MLYWVRWDLPLDIFKDTDVFSSDYVQTSCAWYGRLLSYGVETGYAPHQPDPDNVPPGP